MLREFVEMLETANHRYDVNQMKIDAYTENALGQFSIDLKKAELKVLQESGTDDDLIYLREEAEEGALGKAKKAIDKIIENFKNFVNEIKLKILVIIQKKETKETIETVEKKIRFNPFLARKKVDVENTKDQMSAVAWANSQLQKLLSKIRCGKEVTPEEVTEIADEFDKKMTKAGSVSNAIKTTLADAVKRLKDLGNKMADNIESARKATASIIEDAKGMSEKLFASVSGALNRIATTASSFGKSAINAIVNAWKDLISTIKSACVCIKDKITGNGSNQKSDDDDNVTESVFDDDDLNDLDALLENTSSIFDESNYDYDSLQGDVFTEGKNTVYIGLARRLQIDVRRDINEAWRALEKNGDIVEAKNKMRSAKSSFMRIYDEYKKMNQDKNSVVEAGLGTMYVMWLTVCEVICGHIIGKCGLKTKWGGPIVGIIDGIRALRETFSQWKNDISNKEFTAASLNMARNRVETAFRDTAKALDKLTDAIGKIQDISDEAESMTAKLKKESADDFDQELDDMLALDF